MAFNDLKLTMMIERNQVQRKDIVGIQGKNPLKHLYSKEAYSDRQSNRQSVNSIRHNKLRKVGKLHYVLLSIARSAQKVSSV